MTPPQPIGATSSSRVFLGELLSSRARLRFPGHTQAQPTTPVRPAKPSERHTGLLLPVSLQGVTLEEMREKKSPRDEAAELGWGETAGPEGPGYIVRFGA